MNKIKRLLSLVLVFAMVLSVAAMMAGCENDPKPTDPSAESSSTPESTGGQENTEPTKPSTPSDKTGVYTIKITSIGGLKMAGVSVVVYADNTLVDMVEGGDTDAEGTVSFSLPISDDYAIVLDGAPKGYVTEEYYSFSGNAANIVLTSQLITDKELSDVSEPLKVGDVMYEFTTTLPYGETVTLSEVLAENKMVLLNFWFSTCGPCATEFPYMDEAYQMYKEKGGTVIALDPLEPSGTVATYQNSMGLSFPMAACPNVWATNGFGFSNYPSTVVIDRYGVICLIEIGALTSLRPFTSIFEYFTAEDYTQKLCTNGVGDIISQVRPNQTMDTSENIGAVVNQGEIEVIFRPEADDEYSWPFVVTDKNGDLCLKASNQEIESSYAIIYMDVTLKAGQAVGFDYLSSTENGSDYMHVIVNNEAIFSISGYDEVEEWKSCYPCVATKDGTYEIALCYYKDEADNAGDDTVYIKNLRVVDVKDIDSTAHLPRQAATTEDGFEYTYVEVFYNEADGYYHVGSVNGPLLLVDMMGYTQFSEEKNLWDIVYEGGYTYGEKTLYEAMLNYFTYSSNSSLYGVCTVTGELAEQLKYVAEVAGFDGTENEWLKMCKYYEAYGKDAQQMEDPIKGLAPFSAFEATFGKNVASNFFYYNTVIMPRGKLAKFVPDKSGVYRITSRSESTQGVDGWIFDGNRQELLVYEMDERMWNDNDNVSMVFYMEAGKDYYIDIAFWDVYEVGYIYYDIEYVAPTLEHFRLASPGYFTYDSDATGDAMYHLIAGGIDVIQGEDGYWYEDLGMDSDGNQRYGSKLYADFTGVTGLFSNPVITVPSVDENGNPVYDEDGNPVMIKGMVDMGGFDFSKNENDLYIMAFLETHGNDVEATDAYLRDLWGESYDSYAEIYQIQDVYAGIYHGTGEDLSDEIRSYAEKIYAGDDVERIGCVEVDARLAEILQLLVSKYTFENVDNSWVKLCYYYDYLGPAAE